MRVLGVAASFPSRVVDTDEVLEIIDERSREGFEGDLDRTLRMIKTLSKRSGICERRWLQQDETAFSHVESAIQRALASAGIGADDVDLLIYASVDRQVREPGQSFFLARALGMKRVQCFDILEACAGFGRAAHVAQALLKTGSARNALIVTSEFNVHEGGWGHIGHTLHAASDLEWAFSSFTIGEAATATLLGPEGPDWEFDLEYRSEYADLCMSPISDVQSATTAQFGDYSVSGKGGSRFVSYGLEMETPGIPLIKDIMRRRLDWIEGSQVLLPHTHTKRVWLDVAEDFDGGLHWPFFFICEAYGNVVSSSIPAGLALALEDQLVQPGDRITALMTAAGLSFGIYTFEF